MYRLYAAISIIIGMYLDSVLFAKVNIAGVVPDCVLVVIVTVVLPHAGDRDAVKSGGIIADLIESILQVINTGVVPKPPASVQKLEAIRGLAVLD